MKRVLKILFFGMVVFTVIISAVLLVRHRKSELANMPQALAAPMIVYVQTAEPGELSITEHYLGTIEAVTRAEISPRVTGHLLTVAKDVGDPVTGGEIIARLDDRTLMQQKRALQAGLDSARSDLEEKKEQFERREELFQKNHISEESRDTAKRAYLSAKANVRRLEAEVESAAISIEYALMKAPFDGLITERQQDEGDLAMSGQPVLTVEQPAAGYKVLVNVPQETAGRIAPDAKASLFSDNRTMETTVARVHPAIGPQGLATIELRFEKTPFGLPSGAAIGVDLVTGHAIGIRVSSEAILEYEGNAFVFKINGKAGAEKTRVNVLGRNKGHAVIDGPVSAGDRLITGDESMLLQIGDDTRIRAVKGGE